MAKRRSAKRKAHTTHPSRSPMSSCSSCSTSSPCSSYSKALAVATGIFALIAVLHGYRLFSGFEVKVDGFTVPVWFSGVLALLALGMAYWCYTERCRS